MYLSTSLRGHILVQLLRMRVGKVALRYVCSCMQQHSTQRVLKGSVT